MANTIDPFLKGTPKLESLIPKRKDRSVCGVEQEFGIKVLPDWKKPTDSSRWLLDVGTLGAYVLASTSTHATLALHLAWQYLQNQAGVTRPQRAAMPSPRMLPPKLFYFANGTWLNPKSYCSSRPQSVHVRQCPHTLKWPFLQTSLFPSLSGVLVHFIDLQWQIMDQSPSSCCKI